MTQLDDFTIPGKRHNIKCSLEIRTEDIAGETSGTQTVEKGIKAKVIRASLIIPFKNASDLTAIIKAAESVNSDGERKIWLITNRSANAAGVRQVQFVEQVSWNEDRSQLMWKVSFVLQEYLSNPERVENRQDRSTGIESTGSNSWSRHDQVLEQAKDL